MKALCAGPFFIKKQIKAIKIMVKIKPIGSINAIKLISPGMSLLCHIAQRLRFESFVIVEL